MIDVPLRNKWTTRLGETDLTYVGRSIDNQFVVEALIVRVGCDKSLYLFKLPGTVQYTDFVTAGAPPLETIRCEFSMTKDKPESPVATCHYHNHEETINLSTHWFSEL